MMLGRVKAGLVVLVVVVAQNPRVSVAARAVRRRWCGLLELLFAAMQAQSSNHSGSLVT